MELIVGIAWPAALLVIVVLAFWRFHTAIADLIRNLRLTWRSPSGAQVQAQRQLTDSDSGPSPTPDGTTDLMDLLKSVKSQLSDQTPTAVSASSKPNQDEASRGWETEKRHLQDQMLQQAGRALGWEFGYLNLFLVHNSKMVLRWFLTQHEPVLAQNYYDTWVPTIPDLNERLSILQALVSSGLLDQENQHLNINEKGRAYVRYLDTGEVPLLDYDPR